MKTLIAYSKLTENTKKICEVAAKAFENVEVLEVNKVKNLDYDLIIVGT